LIPGIAFLLALALSTPPAAGPAPAPAKPAPGAARTQPLAPCTRYRVQVEKNVLADERQLASWATTSLDQARLLDPASPCYLHVRITAAPIRSGGREDGWMAHVGISTRRYLKDGKLVTHEKGMLFVEPTREALVPRARGFIEEFIATLGTAPATLGGDSG
jgi:hypothetical protein